MKVRLFISMLVICFAIGGITFTTMFFYDFNTKIVMVEEVQEETGEDISSLENNSEEHFFHNWGEVISTSAIHVKAEISLSQMVCFKTNKGYFLDLIKPPII